MYIIIFTCSIWELGYIMVATYIKMKMSKEVHSIAEYVLSLII
jgi:hypothetical protein